MPLMHVNYKVKANCQNQQVFSQYINQQINYINKGKMDNNMEIEDLDEALSIISIKNDEINSLKSNIKTTEKRNGTKLADLQFKIEQEKAKSVEVERKILKSEQNLLKLKEQHVQQVHKLQNETHKLSEVIAELHAQQRRKQRQFKAIIFEQKLKFQREKEFSCKVSNELEQIYRHFDPKKILSLVSKNSLQEIPCYIDLYHKNQEKFQEIKQMSLQMEKLRSETILSIEESFKKLSSYEAVMQSLNEKNKELEESISQKEEELELHNLQIYEKKQLLETVKEQAHEQFENLNNQIYSLRSYVDKYQNGEEENTNQSIYQGDYQNAVEELERVIESTQNEMEDMQYQYEQKLSHLNELNIVLKKELQELQNQSLSEKQYVQATFTRLKNTIAEKDDLIIILNASIRDQQEFFEQKKSEYQKYLMDLNELLKKKKRIDEQYRQNQAFYKQRTQSLQQEVEYLKMQLYNAARQQDVDEFHPIQEFGRKSQSQSLKRVKSGFASLISIGEHRNLFADIKDNSQLDQDDRASKIDIGNYEQEPNWSELYYSLLCKHNEFAKKVQARLIALKSQKFQSKAK